VSLIELSDQQSAIRLEDPTHLLHSGLLIIFGDVVQGQRASYGVERGIGKGESLRESHLKSGRNLLLARSGGRTFDHLGGCIDTGDRSGGCHTLGERHRQLAGAASHIENPITGVQSKIIGKGLAEAPATSAEQTVHQVVRPSPVDEAVMVVIHQIRVRCRSRKLRGFADVEPTGDS
jgi:hypothetical protein